MATASLMETKAQKFYKMFFRKRKPLNKIVCFAFGILILSSLFWKYYFGHDTVTSRSTYEDSKIRMGSRNIKRKTTVFDKTLVNCPEEFRNYNNNTINTVVDLNLKDNLPKVLILTPVKDSTSMLETYFKLLCGLSYPHHLISVALGEDSSSDHTYKMALHLVRSLQGYFRKLELHKLDLDFHLPPKILDRHSYKWQLPRRQHLARVRNSLLSKSLQDEDWVLWIDSDLVHYDHNLIQRLLVADKDIVTTSCMTKDPKSNKFRLYDRNSWRETEASRNFVEGKLPSYLMLEGYYEPPMRIYLPKLSYEGDLVRLDGVGGCALLVRAKCHRDGLVFPAFVYKHHIETEGLAKMAPKFHCDVYGLPKYNVLHKVE